MAVALLLHPVLEDHGDAENEDKVDADNAKGSREDLVQKPVGERRELANTTTLLRCNKGIKADVVLNEGRCGRVCVAAAIELDFCQHLTCMQRRSAPPRSCRLVEPPHADQCSG